MRHLLIIDTETTAKNDTAADFGAVLIDFSRPTGPDGYGQIVRTLGSYVWGHFNEKGLWFDPYAPKESFWSRQNVAKRQKAQESEVDEGTRNIAAPNNINGWLGEIAEEYSPIATAYNWSFDLRICRNTGINVDQFQHGPEWCLMNLSRKHFLNDLAYIAHCKANGFFTKKGNISFTANSVSNFVFWQRGNVRDPEPHTALEDAKVYELPIAQELFAHGWLDVLKQEQLPAEETE